MKKTLLVAIVAVLSLAGASQANAQFRFGLKAGVCVNEFKFDTKMFDSDNRAGFTGGAMVEFTVPVIGVGVDASALYVRRSGKWIENNVPVDAPRDYIDIPINLKYKLSLPGVSKIVAPYVLTGPDFAFLCSKKTVENMFKSESVSYSWNFGFGVELVQHLQIGATYGIGLNKAIKTIHPDTQGIDIEGKNRYWTVTAAYLF